MLKWRRLVAEIFRIAKRTTRALFPTMTSSGGASPVINQQKPGSARSRAVPRPAFWNAIGLLDQQAFRERAQERVFAAGARIMHEGAAADCVMVILKGEVDILVDDDGLESIIAKRGPGELVGERAILDAEVRSATVKAREMVNALVMSTEEFAAYVSARPPVFAIVEGQFGERRAEDPVRYHDAYIPFTADGADELGEPYRTGQPRGRKKRNLIGENCTIVYNDVVGFGSPKRSDEDRSIIRRELMSMTASSLSEIWDECSCENRGDGLLVVVSPNIPTGLVLEYLLEGLPRALRRHNRVYGAGVQIQLRVAVDVGPVKTDEVGASGQVIINAARLLDAPAFKDAVSASRANLGVIVSGFVRSQVVMHTDGLSEPGAFREVDVRLKEAEMQGWMRLIDPAPRTRRRSLTAAWIMVSEMRQPVGDGASSSRH